MDNSITDLGIVHGLRTPYSYILYTFPFKNISGFVWADPNDPDTAVGYHPELAPTVPPVTIQLSDCWGDFEVVDYPGAFEHGTKATFLWIRGWITIDAYGYLNPNPELPCCAMRRYMADNQVLVNDIVCCLISCLKVVTLQDILLREMLQVLWMVISLLTILSGWLTSSLKVDLHQQTVRNTSLDIL